MERELDEGDPGAVVHGAWVGEEVVASAQRSGFEDEVEAQLRGSCQRG